MARMPLRPEARAMQTVSLLITALMVALGIAALAAAAALRHVDLDWRVALEDRWTVELPGAAPANPDEAAQKPDETAQKPDDGARAVAVLRGLPGVADANLLGADEVRHLLQPWLGDAAEMPDLPLPRLIDLRLDPAGPADHAALAKQIAGAVPGATLDDHSRWTGELEHLAQTGEVLGLVLFGIALLAAMLTVTAVARARLAVNQPEVRLLHQIGASDGYIARQFHRHAIRVSVPGALLGTVLAAGAGFALIKKGADFAPLLPRLRLDQFDWAALAAVPIAAVLLTGFVAQATAWALVRRLP